jgi:CubicO group peptidase (beta-lactamase class C family)
MHKEKMVTIKLQAITSLLLALIILSAPIIAGTQTVSGQSTQPLASQIDQYIREQMKQKNIVGLSVAIEEDNEIVYVKGFGTASIEKDTKRFWDRQHREGHHSYSANYF